MTPTDAMPDQPMRRRCHNIRHVGMLVTFLAVIVCRPSGAAAHDDPDHRIAATTTLIQSTPGDYALYLRRAQLHEQAQHWNSARIDANIALRLRFQNGQNCPEAQFVRARALDRLGEHGAAIKSIDRVIRCRPEWTDAWECRARLIAERGDIAEACRNIEYVLRVRQEYTPDLTLQLAQWYCTISRSTRAVEVIDRALAQCGHIPVLIDAAARIEVNAGEYGRAIARWTALASASSRPEQWLLLIADAFLAMERWEDAQAMLTEAQDAMHALPERRRNTRQARALTHAIQQRISMMHTTTETRTTHE